MQFVVPQFIEVEAKIIGPISARQFIILLVALGVNFLWYKLFPVYIFLPGIILTCMAACVLAFAKINGQAMHYVLLNLIQTLRRPRLRIWARTEYVEREEDDDEPERAPVVLKPHVSASRLAAMSLMVDTGGVYATDDVRQTGASASVNGQAAPQQPEQTPPESSNMNLK
jgi:hypothetical protein